jgi:GTP-binding protein EngB required for normal cell division
VKISEAVSRWFGRVEVAMAGADAPLREAEEALAIGDAMRARRAAHTLLQRVPRSPLGLALLADACELGGLDAELCMTLEELSARVGSRADLWLRLGRARGKTQAPVEEVRDAFIRALAVAEAASPARRDAVLALADLDLAALDGERADLWLDRLGGDTSAELHLRRAEARLHERDASAALKWLDRDPEDTGKGLLQDPLAGRRALARGKAYAMLHDARTFVHLLRAYLLDVPGGSEALSSALAYVPSSPEERARVRTVVEGKGDLGHVRWQAAFARAEGRRDEARRALLSALNDGARDALGALLVAVLEDCDIALLQELGPHLDHAVTGDASLADEAHVLREALAVDAQVLREALSAPSPTDRFDRLGALRDPLSARMAHKLRADAARALIPADALAQWDLLLARLERRARELADLETLSGIGSLALERARPLRVAVVGEFNAGKSTFINALLGAEVAPTGILPTTGTLHHLRYAKSPAARIMFHRDDAEKDDRIVPVGELRATLKDIDTGRVRRVEIFEPLPFLTRVEVLDTPGFNAPDPRHAQAAREAFDEADVILWLLDAGQAMKLTERAILEELRDASLPIQVLVNKADRLSDADLERVLSLVSEALTETRVRSLHAPAPFSAKLALEGRLGDDTKLARSRWREIEAILQQAIENQSESLKERALRRRAARLVGKLGSTAARLAEQERAEHEARDQRFRAEQRGIAELERDRTHHVQALERALAPAVDDWRRGIALVVVGRDDTSQDRDPALLEYRVSRAQATLVPPLEAALTRLAHPASLEPRELTLLARSLVFSFATQASAAPAVPRSDVMPSGDPSTLPTPPSPAHDPALRNLASAALGVLVMALLTRSTARSGPRRNEALLAELEALAHALGGAPSATGEGVAPPSLAKPEEPHS